jgi:hypothetical protein
LLASSDKAGRILLDDGKARLSSQLDWASSEIEKIRVALPELVVGSTKQSVFAQAREILREWQERLEDLDARSDPFSVATSCDCGFAFGGTKTTEIKLKRVDRMPGGDGATEEVLSVAVECTSPFTVSAGLALGSVRQQQFAIRPTPAPTGDSTVNTVATTSDSRFSPVPMGALHARLWEPNETIALHASLGVAGKLRGQSEGGSDVVLLIGPSLSLHRTMFITAGLYLGSETKLGAPFKVGDSVPATITEPTLEKSFRPAFGFAVTFRKP